MTGPSVVEAIHRGPPRANGLATILAIGTATPPNAVDQSTYPDYYFRVTNMEHDVELKEKFRNLCEKTMIKKRYLILNEDMLKKNPSLCADMAPSLDIRQDIAAAAVPKLGAEAAARAIEEWGQPKSKITHLVVCSTSGVDIPGADFRITQLLGLRPSIKRVMIYNQACYAGGTALRLAKDLAENSRDARVLVVCAEVSVVNFRGPNGGQFGNLVGQAIFGDGAAALIVGADPVGDAERPLFEIVSAAQAIIPGSDGAIAGHLREAGMTFHLVRGVPDLISENIEAGLGEAFGPLGISDWNSIFWVVHAGGRKILDRVEARMGLGPEKLRASRHVLSEFGNMSSACVLFTLDEMRRTSAAEGRGTTGEGLEWGVLLGFGPGLTVETVVLRSVAN